MSHPLSIPRLGFFAACSGLLLSLPWCVQAFWPVIFVSLVPILLLNNELAYQKASFSHSFFLSYTAFFVMNTCVAWWLVNSSLSVFVLALVINPLLMSVPSLLYVAVISRIAVRQRMLLFASLWVGWEWVQLHVGGFVPWLVFGNALAASTRSIQWFEFSGVLGGSSWVILANIFVFKIIEGFVGKKIMRCVVSLVAVIVIIVVPVVFSRWWGVWGASSLAASEILIVQPNIDCHTEKFGNMSQELQINRMLELTRSSVTRNTGYILYPETAIHRPVHEDSLRGNSLLDGFTDLLAIYPRASIMLGCITTRGGVEYNSILFLGRGRIPQVYHKQKLLPGVEYVPFLSSNNFLIAVGGAPNAFGFAPRDSVFRSPLDCRQIIPVICYESAFGEYVASRVGRETAFIAIATNDGWWGNTPGHVQHHDLARLRAIETRKPIARCANTGISSFINACGDTLSTIGYGKAGTLLMQMPSSHDVTFYSRWGDWPGLLAFLALSLFVVYNRHFKSRKNPY